LVREAICSWWEEPRIYGGRPEDEPNRRPDAIVASHTVRYMIDVSVINPTAKSYLPTGKYAAHREKQKTKRYKQLARSEGCEFVPFVMESYGAWGEEATNFLRKISDEYSSDEEEAAAFYRRAVCALSFALQSGNAHVAGVGCIRTHGRRVGTVRAVLVPSA
jgi:hypothetical protein